MKMTKRNKPAAPPKEEAVVETPAVDKKKKKAVKRPDAPKSFTWNDITYPLVVIWDAGEGMNAGAALIESQKYIWNEEQERWVETLNLIIHRGIGFGNAKEVSKSYVTIHRQRTDQEPVWMGPREIGYALRYPNEKEMITCQGVINKAKQIKEERTAERVTRSKAPRDPNSPKAEKYHPSNDQPFRPGSGKDSIYRTLQQSKGLTLEQLKALAVKAGKSPALIGHVITRLRELKLLVEQKGKFQIVGRK